MRIQLRKYVIHIKGLILLIIISVRQIILKGGAEYPITPKCVSQSTLYKDPQNYSAHDILSGFLPGEYLFEGVSLTCPMIWSLPHGLLVFQGIVYRS